MKKLTFLLFIVLSTNLAFTQLPDNCKLNIGTNLGGVSDYATEIPFVDMMKACRIWYTQDANNPAGSPFDTEAADSLTYRTDGYPTHIPQVVPGRAFTQKVSTIWAVTTAWKPGTYVVLFDGVGELSFSGGHSDLILVNPNKYSFSFTSPVGNFLQMTIENSLASDPIRNIRVLHQEYETTYLTQPFNPIWLDKILVFKSVRFMDWGQTNNWGQSDQWSWDDPTLFNWNERSKLEYYTWTHSKGIPYEMMIKLMNDYDLDGWVCVPHRASNDYIDNMATLFYNNLEPNRELTVEFSNEIWNWMFGQTNWCFKYGCTIPDLSWPEGIVPYIQNCLNRWTTIYGSDVNRIKRAVGLQTGWLDVSQRIAYNMNPSSFDVVSPTYYFALDGAADAELDVLGASATAADVESRVRAYWEVNEQSWLNQIKTTISDSLNKPIYFYEGGQHITPTPFGEEPTYAQALIDIQRSPLMYNMYNDWYNFLRTLQSGTQPLKLMNFSFIGERSARYGSWGILETMTQDTTIIPAPKYQSTIENMNTNCSPNSIDNTTILAEEFTIYPNPTNGHITISFVKNGNFKIIRITDMSGKLIINKTTSGNSETIDFSDFTYGVYIIRIQTSEKIQFSKLIKQ